MMALASPEQSSIAVPGAAAGTIIDVIWLGVVLAAVYGVGLGGRSISVLMLATLSLAAGASVYALWGRLEPFYALPFFAGLAVVVGIGIQRLRRTVICGILGVLAVVVAALAVRSDRFAVEVDSRREAELAALKRLSSVPPEDTVIVRKRYLPVQAWQSPAATMARFRTALHLAGRAVLLSHTCGDTRDMQQKAHRLYLTYEADCGHVVDALWRSTSSGKRTSGLALSERPPQ
jgi:hypothetical protein